MGRAEAAGSGPSPQSLFEAIDARLDGLVSPERAGHSRRTAELAAGICGRNGIDPERGRAAGIAHDLCKELPKAEQRSLAALYPEAAATSSVMIEKAMHGPAAAALLRRDYGVRDEGILEAVAFHTIGRVGMGTLAAALYCADKLEGGREGVEEAFRAECLGLPPKAMLAAVIRRNVEWIESRGKVVAPETLVLYNSLSNGAAAE